MPAPPRSSTTLIVIIIFSGVVFALGNLAMLTWSVRGAFEVPLLVEFSRACMPCVAYFVAAPLVVAILVAIMLHRLVAGRNRDVSTATAGDVPSESPTPALRLLAILQQEGRFVDFIQEDIATYDDAQVGAAVRSIHAGCRKVLAEHLALERLYTADEGSTVSVEKGFDPSSIHLSGNVTGEPPFRGTLQHGGWRATRLSLPEAPSGADAQIIAPAEVEIP